MQNETITLRDLAHAHAGCVAAAARLYAEQSIDANTMLARVVPSAQRLLAIAAALREPRPYEDKGAIDIYRVLAKGHVKDWISELVESAVSRGYDGPPMRSVDEDWRDKIRHLSEQAMYELREWWHKETNPLDLAVILDARLRTDGPGNEHQKALDYYGLAVSIAHIVAPQGSAATAG